MRIDWFTVIAQAVNFLVLMAILKILLFDRIVAAIDARKDGLASERAEAEAAHLKAEAARARAESARDEIEEAREQYLREARDEAEEHRESLEREARADVARMRERLRVSLRDERRQLVSDLVRTAGEGVTSAARRALVDLADADLDQRMVTRLCQSLRQSDTRQRAALQAAWGQLDEPLLIRSSRPLSEQEHRQLSEALHAALIEGEREPKLEYQVSDELACGIEISGGGHAVGWSIRSYLSEVQEELQAALSEESLREAGEAEREAEEAERPHIEQRMNAVSKGN